MQGVGAPETLSALVLCLPLGSSPHSPGAGTGSHLPVLASGLGRHVWGLATGATVPSSVHHSMQLFLLAEALQPAEEMQWRGGSRDPALCAAAPHTPLADEGQE